MTTSLIETFNQHIMMKYISLLLLLFVSLGTASAQKQLTRTGHIWFYSHTAVEDIEAHNHQAVSILNQENGELVFQVLMTGFQFEKALMQEHFNEKYVESEKYPKATFKGQVVDFGQLDLAADGEYPVKVAGELSIHGVTQTIETEGVLLKNGDAIAAKSEFIIKPEAYKVKIPALVRDNIAEEISIYVDMAYQPM